MPVSPALAESLAQNVVEQYAEAERILLERIARSLAKGLDDPEWAERKLAEVQFLTVQTRRLVADLGDKAAAQIALDLVKAYNRGGAAAASELAALLGISLYEAATPLYGLPPVELLVAETAGYVLATGPRILRSTIDAYRQVIAETASQVLIGSQTRREAAQAALDRFAARGITGFVDKAGRGWNLESYVEMAMRTGAGKAAVQGHTERLLEHGFDLVIISDAPRECPLCLAPGTIVEGPAVEWRSRLEYSGDLVRIETASGKHLVGTPNHTVLTPKGWRRLKDLKPGHEVISHSGQEWDASVVPDYEQTPVLIEEAGQFRAPALLAGPTRRNLDSDLAYREVHVVPADSPLHLKSDAAFTQPFCKLGLIGRVRLRTSGFAFRDLAGRFLGVMAPPPGIMGRFYHRPTLRFAGVGPTLAHVGTGHGGAFLGTQVGHVGHDTMMARAGLDSGAAQIVGYHTSADSEGGAQLLRALSGLVATDKVVSLSIGQFAGHVWDLQTGPSWYSSNGIISHNCRPWEGKILSISGKDPDHPTLEAARNAGLFHANCRHSAQAYQEGITKPEPAKADPEGYAAAQKQRYLERKVRESKRLASAALDDAAAQKAKARIGAYQAKLREHVAAHKLKRLSYREQIGKAH